MRQYHIVLLKDNHKTEDFADVYFRDENGEPHYIQANFNGCAWGMYGFRDNEEFTSPHIFELFLQLYQARYEIHDPFNLIGKLRLWTK